MRIKFGYSLFIVIALFALLIAAGCSNSGAGNTDDGTGETPADAPSQSEEPAAEPLSMGDPGTTSGLDAFTVESITVTDSLTSAEASALLQIGAPGESPDPDTAAASGSELLLITMVFTGNQEVTNIFPADMMLMDADDTEFEEVTTNGHGGIFNHDPSAAGVESTVTAVYEVPTGSTGLTFMFQPFGEDPLIYQIR